MVQNLSHFLPYSIRLLKFYTPCTKTQLDIDTIFLAGTILIVYSGRTKGTNRTPVMLDPSGEF